WRATASPAWIVPPTMAPGGNPVIAVPGLTPRSPVMTVAPVFVTVDAPRTANDSAEPRAACANAGIALNANAMTPAVATSRVRVPVQETYLLMRLPYAGCITARSPIVHTRVRQLQPSGDNTVRPADQAAAGRAEPAEGRARLSRERVCR